MAKRDQFSAWPSKWALNDWQKYIEDMTYKVVKPIDLPGFFQKNPISSKFNSAIITCSGSSEATYYGIQGLRPDNKNTVIDEDLYAVIFDKKTGNSYAGFLHHGNYPGRTTPVPKDITDLLIASGSTTEISFERIPSASSGSLFDLEREGIITGTSKIFKRIRNEWQRKK